MKNVLAGLLTMCVAASAAAQTAVDYRFDDVKRKVVLTTPKTSQQVAKGQHATSGDKVETGWFSYAVIAAERFRAKFEIFSATDVRLAEGAPGVILSVERGKLHAIFDKITGSEPRVVKTPGALLAVRGTQYDVDVDKDGKTTLRVTDGTVEVRSENAKEPTFVHAGEMTTFSRHEAPGRPTPNDHMQPPNGRHGEADDHGRGTEHGQPPPPQGRGMTPPPPPTPRPGGH